MVLHQDTQTKEEREEKLGSMQLDTLWAAESLAYIYQQQDRDGGPSSCSIGCSPTANHAEKLGPTRRETLYRMPSFAGTASSLVLAELVKVFGPCRRRFLFIIIIVVIMPIFKSK